MTREQEQVFDKVVFGGYDAEQVDDYRAETEIALKALQKENAVLVQKLRILAAKVEELQEKEASPEKPAEEAPAMTASPAAAEIAENQQTLQAQLDGARNELSQARKSLAEESAKSAAALEALAKRKTEELAFCRDLMEKYAARQQALTEEAPAVPAVFKSETAEPVVEPVVEPVAVEPVATEPVAAEPVAAEPAASQPVAEDVFATKVFAKIPAVSEKSNAEKACPKPAEPMSESDRQTYEECLARILQQEAKEANLKPGESRLVSLRPAKGVMRKEDDSAGKNPAPAPPKKKKEGFFDFVKESVRKALSDDDEDDDFPPSENEPLQFGRAYDVKKRK